MYDAGIATHAEQPKPPQEIVIIGLTEKFIDGRPVGLMPRDRLAQLLTAVASGSPSVVVLDVWLDSRIDSGPKGQDAQLRSALALARKQGVPILLPQVNLNIEEQESSSTAASQHIPGSGLTARGATLPFFSEVAGGVGGADFTPDPDATYRTLTPGSLTAPTISLLAAKVYSKKAMNPLSDTLLSRLDREAAPIDFRTGPGQIQITPAEKLLQEPALAFLLQDKIVFIGATFPRSGDFFVTPFQTLIDSGALSQRSTMARRQMYGVELLAHATDTILRGAPRHSHQTREVQSWIVGATLLLAAVVAAAALRGAIPGVAAAVLALGGALAIAVWSARDASPLFMGHYWPLSPFLTVTLLASGLGIGYRQIQEARELRRVKEVFGGYVGDEVLQKLGGKMPEMGGEMEEIAIFFCDIAGFSALAEGMQDDPARLLQTLNGHFEPLVIALQNRGAYVDNYVGDLIMALFGAPVSAGSRALNTRNAVLAAVDFVRIVGERNATRHAAGEPVIEVGIGVHCGPAVVGNLGSQRRMKYTAIGDTVNIASRVESTTRKFDTRLLVTEEVVQSCADDAEVMALGWEFVAETQVKGRSAPVRLYRCQAAS
jgi:class 3 adenylate cyclase/CHASE2 domain-containing sensor protein